MVIMDIENIHLLKYFEVKRILSSQLPADFSQDFERQWMQIKSLPNESIEVQKFLKWCEPHRSIQCVRADVPRVIIPGAELIDVKVGSAGRRREPDDRIYDRNEDIRRRVARGNCVLRLPDNQHLCLTHALKKFTGGMGDEDDDPTGRDDSTWRRYFLRPLEEATRVVVTHKANGEAAHLSARYVNGSFLLCVGSKNVHMVLRRESDIALYDGQRYRVAKVVAAGVWRLLETMEDEQRQLLLSFLHHTRFTAVLELLQPDHQHVEDLSHLEEAEVLFIAWTPTLGEMKSYCSCSPELGFHLAEKFGLKTVERSVVTHDILDILPSVMQEVREGYGDEGKVLYFVDSDENVIGLLKKKTVWYVLLRALREKLCHGLQKLCFKDLKASIEKRFCEIQRWLGFDDQFLREWLKLSFAFAEWLKNDPSVDYSTLRTTMPPRWKKFLHDTGRTDKFDIVLAS